MKRARSWYTGDPIQAKYLLLVFASMLIPLVIAITCMSFLLRWFNTGADFMPPEMFEEMFSAYDKLKLFWVISITACVISMLLWSLHVSNRLVGPIRRLERTLDKLIAGDLSQKATTREKDDLKGIADRINALVKKLRSRP